MGTLELLDQSLNVDYVALLIAKNRCSANIPIEDVMDRYQIPLSFLDECLDDPEFEGKIKKHIGTLQADGFSVEAKAAMLHEMGLPIVFRILQDPDAPASARLKAHEQLGDIAQKGKLAAKVLTAAGASNGYQLIINLGPAPGSEANTPSKSESFEGVTIVQEQPATPRPATLIDSDNLFPAAKLALYSIHIEDHEYYEAEA